MLYAVISDVHGNYPALKAVLEDARAAGAERFLLAGDYITDLHYTREIYETLRDLPGAYMVSGNREWYMETLDPAQRGREQAAPLFLTREDLGEDGLAWVRGLPRSLRLSTPDGKKTILVEHICEEVNGPPHAKRGGRYLSSGNLNEEYRGRTANREDVEAFALSCLEQNPLLDSLWERAHADVVIHGHNHLQYTAELNGVLYMNPGSCGMPADHQIGAPYILLRYEDGAFSAEERRPAYDIEGTLREYKASRFYREAEVWCEMVSWIFTTAKDHNRLFFRILKEENEKNRPQTDEEHNMVFRRAYELTRQEIDQDRRENGHGAAAYNQPPEPADKEGGGNS